MKTLDSCYLRSGIKVRFIAVITSSLRALKLSHIHDSVVALQIGSCLYRRKTKDLNEYSYVFTEASYWDCPPRSFGPMLCYDRTSIPLVLISLWGQCRSPPFHSVTAFLASRLGGCYLNSLILTRFWSNWMHSVCFKSSDELVAVESVCRFLNVNQCVKKKRKDKKKYFSR